MKVIGHIQSIIDTSSKELGPRAISHLSTANIYGLRIKLYQRETCSNAEKKIIVFDGLKHLIYYHIALIIVLDLLPKQRVTAIYIFPTGEVISESLAFSLAAWVGLAAATRNLRLLLVGYLPLAPLLRLAGFGRKPSLNFSDTRPQHGFRSCFSRSLAPIRSSGL